MQNSENNKIVAAFLSSFPASTEEAYWNWSLPTQRLVGKYYGTVVVILTLSVFSLQTSRHGFAFMDTKILSVVGAMVLCGLMLVFASIYMRSATLYRNIFCANIFLTYSVNLAGAWVGKAEGAFFALEGARLILFTFPFLPANSKTKTLLLIIASAGFAVTSARRSSQTWGETMLATFCLFIVIELTIVILEYFFRQAFLLQRALQRETDRSEQLLRNIFPGPIFQRVRNQDKPSFVQRFPDASVLFADLAGFTQFANKRSAEEVVSVLDRIMSRLDASCDELGAVKVKTIGDAYLAVSGLPDPDPDHIFRMADLAFEFREAVRKISHLTGHDFQLRIGLHVGPVVAGIIGQKTAHFDIWGDTVNYASRLESHGLAGEIQVSDELAQRLSSRYELVERGIIEIKGRGPANTWILIRPKLGAEPSGSSHGAA